MSFWLSILGDESTPLPDVPVFSSYSLESTQAIIEEFDTGNDWHGRPSIIERDGVWIMAFIEGDEHTTNGSQKTQIAFSTNRGVTWGTKNTFTNGNPVSGFVRQGDGGSATCTAEVQLINSPNGDILAIVHDRDSSANWIDSALGRSSDGGATWSYTSIGTQFEGGGTQTWAFYDHFIDGQDIYIACSVSVGQLVNDNAKSMLYRSSDYGITWTKVSDITTSAEKTWEVGIIMRPDRNILSIIRTSLLNESGAQKEFSTDLGLNWTTLSNISIGGGLHQPNMRYFDREDRLYCSGRFYTPSTNYMQNCFIYSDDNGATWILFKPEESTNDDGGYTKLIKRSDDTFYMVGYKGTLGVGGSLYEWIIKGNV